MGRAEPGVWFKLLRASPAEERYTNLLRVAPGGLLARHRHPGPVEAWVVKGTWRYLEHDWVAKAGDYVYEPIGDVHTLVVDPAEEMITLFQVSGGVVYLDDQDREVRTTPRSRSSTCTWRTAARTAARRPTSCSERRASARLRTRVRP